MLGPLLNPAGAVYGLIGVYSPDISMLMAQALQQLGTRKALVVHSQVTPIPQWCFDSPSYVPLHILHIPHLMVWMHGLACFVALSSSSAGCCKASVLDCMAVSSYICICSIVHVCPGLRMISKTAVS